MVQKREIVTCILLSVFTCGIYGLIWFYNITNDVATVSEDNSISGGMAILLSLVTCGIYTIYWNFAMGKRLHSAKLKTSDRADDNSVLYLVLSLFGLSIVNYCLMQNELNTYAK